MPDVIKDPAGNAVKTRKADGGNGVHAGLKVTDISFGGYSNEKKDASEWMKEQGRELVSMGSQKADEQKAGTEASAMAAASLAPGYIAAALGDWRAGKKETAPKQVPFVRKPVSNDTGAPAPQEGQNNTAIAQTGQRAAAMVQERQKNTAVLPEPRTAEGKTAEIEKARQAYAEKQNRRQQVKKRNKQGNVQQPEHKEQRETGGTWMQGAVRPEHVTTEEIIKKCGICQKSDYGENVQRPAQEAGYYLSENETGNREDLMVCSAEERKQREEQKEIKEKESKESIKKSEKKKKKKKQQEAGKRYAQKAIIRKYLIAQGMNPEEPEIETGLQKVTMEIFSQKVRKVLDKLWKRLRKILLISALFIFLIDLIVSAVLMPCILFITLLLHPISFFLGQFDSNEELNNNPTYLKNVIQERYEDFYDDISDFANEEYPQGHLNQVVYADGYQSNAGAVAAVYLASVCTDEDYSAFTDGKDSSDDVPYLLVDTEDEKDRLDEIFEEFNFMETENIAVNVKVDVTDEETGEVETTEQQAEAEKMTVHTLSLAKWKNQYPDALSEEAKKMLKILEPYAIRYMNGTGEGNGSYTPITGINIPEGSDQNLVYMAAFIKAEAGGQIFEGKVAVAYVILNRAGGASGNIIGVLTAPYQFSCYIPNHTVERYLEEYARMSQEQRDTDPCWQAAAGAYTGAVSNPIGDFRYYCNPKGCSVGEAAQWAKIRAKNREEDIIVIGDHVFCRNCW